MVAAVLPVRYDHEYSMISRLLKIMIASPLLVACTAPVEAASAPDADTSETAAQISIETTSYANDSAAPHSTAIARFIRGVGIDDATLQMLGASNDLPKPGTCAGVSARVSNSRAVELLDVGAVTIDVAGHASLLAPRNVPDMNDLVWGVVYSARTDGEDAPLSGPISIRVAGSKDVGALSIDIADMRAPEGVAFDDAPPPLTLRGNDDVHVTWTAAAASRDIVYFEVDNGTETLTCAYDDSGSATLPASIFAAVPAGAGSIVVHRLHREAVTTRGIDEGEARFDFARVYDFVAP
jgi:hypothetical protein